MSQNQQFRTLVSRLQALHALYSNFTMQYLALSLSARRYLYGNDATSTQQIRAMAQAKFILAATLQWRPAENGYNITSFVHKTAGIEAKTNEGNGNTEDEMCPVWIDFFDEVMVADGLLSRSDDQVPLSTVNAMLDSAEVKYLWLNSLFAMLLKGGQYIRGPCDIELTDTMVFIGWNRFCIKVAKGMSPVDAAVTTIRPARGVIAGHIDSIHSGQHSRREYFSFAPSAAFQPWLPQPVTQPENTHSTCADNSLCHQGEDLCPCKARGQDCQNSSCMRSGPWKWPCLPKAPVVVRYEVPSYGGGHHCVEDAAEAGELFNGVMYQQLRPAREPLLIEATPILRTYNAIWESISPIDYRIAFPTPTYSLHAIVAKSGLPLAAALLKSLPTYYVVFLKTKCFFLSGLEVPYDVSEYPLNGALIVPRFGTFDTRRMEAMLMQMAKEGQRWRADLLSERTGVSGTENKDLGDDFVVVGIRMAIEELVEDCEMALSKARHEELYCQ